VSECESGKKVRAAKLTVFLLLEINLQQLHRREWHRIGNRHVTDADEIFGVLTEADGTHLGTE